MNMANLAVKSKVGKQYVALSTYKLYYSEILFCTGSIHFYTVLLENVFVTLKGYYVIEINCNCVIMISIF